MAGTQLSPPANAGWIADPALGDMPDRSVEQLLPRAVIHVPLYRWSRCTIWFMRPIEYQSTYPNPRARLASSTSSPTTNSSPTT